MKTSVYRDHPLVEPASVLHAMLHGLSGSELQTTYDESGRSIRALHREFCFDGLITRKRLAKTLYDAGVILSKYDLEKYGLFDSGERARLENSMYSFDLGDGFDPNKLALEAVECDLDPSIFETMDYRELPNPKNVLEWVTGKEFLDTTIFPRQLQLNMAFFEEYCWWCSDNNFVKDMHLSPYMGEDGYRRPWTMDEIQERVTLTEHGRCPKCKRTYIDNLNNPDAPHKFPTEIDACVGQRAGKTRGAEHMMTYNEARYHLVQGGPQRFFGEDSVQVFTAFYTALSLSQASDTLWGAVQSRVRHAPWWKTYHGWLDAHGKRLGAELYKFQETSRVYYPRMLQSALVAPFAKNVRGRTGCQMGIDEIGMFAKGDSAIKANADEVHQSFNNCLVTLRNDAETKIRKGAIVLPRPAMFCISSPWSLLDKIMTLVRTADQDATRVAFHYATWDFNPTQHRDSRVMKAEYAKDPVKAERDFAAVPPHAVDPFHTNPDLIDTLIKPEINLVCQQQTRYARTSSGNCYVYATPSRLVADKVTPRLMVLDAGETDNSFAVTIWRITRLPAPSLDVFAKDGEEWLDEDDEDLRVVYEAAAANTKPQATTQKEKPDGQVWYLQPDAVMEVQPFIDESGVNWKVNFQKMYDNLIVPLVKSLNIVGVASDRWNITQILNGIEAMGVPVIRYSLTWPDFQEFESKTSRREIRIPKPEIPQSEVFKDYDRALRGSPILHLLTQYKTVRQVGRSVQKPQGGTDDLYRTMVLANYIAFSEDAVAEKRGKENITFHQKLQMNGEIGNSHRAVSVVLGRSGGGSGTSQSTFSRVGGLVQKGATGTAAYSKTKGGK